MSTRAVIAREIDAKQGKFAGRYHHSDGYPSGLGATLHDLWNGHFEKDTSAMLKVLLDDHPAGWSSINGADFTLKPGYSEYNREEPNQPRCYCHGQRSEEAMEITESDDTDCQWAYVFLKDRPAVQVLKPIHNKEYKVIGWEPAGEAVELDKPEPNWEKIECGENLEHCNHYAWFHDKTICRNCNGKGVVEGGGHRVGFSHDCRKCVPDAKAPATLRRNDPQWHHYKPATGWKCRKCKGTGKALLAA